MECIYYCLVNFILDYFVEFLLLLLLLDFLYLLICLYLFFDEIEVLCKFMVRWRNNEGIWIWVLFWYWFVLFFFCCLFCKF